ncbi:MAG: Ig-like domain-containing protein, partial [Steroidobacteraceae bacterium]
TTVEFLAPGTYVLRLTASDGQLSASDDVQLAVTSANNTAPQLAPIASRSIERGSTLRVQLAASDNEPFDVLSYSLGAAPSGATLDARGLLEWSANATGTFTFTVSVRDPQGLTDTRSFQVTVTAADHAPLFAPLPGERTVIGAAWRRTIGVTDPDGDAVTLELIEGPAGMTLAGHALAWRPTAAQSGSATVQLRARDPAGNATGAAFNLEVDGNAVPVARDDSYRVRVGDAPLVVAPSGVLANDADPDGASLSASRLSSPAIGTLQSFGADGGFTYQPPATDPRPAFALQARALAPGREWNDLYSVPLVGDLDRDGRPDLVFDWLNQNHTAISGRDGSVLWEADRTPLAGCFDYIGASGERVLADLDDDGRLEYVFSTACGNETQLVALDSTGHVKWRTPSFTAPLLVETCNGIGVCSGPAQLQYDPLTLATPSVARLAPGDAPVLLVHRTINANDASIQTHLDANTIGTRSIGCRAVTGDPADEHQACRVTWIVSGADGHVLQLLRAPAGLVDGVGRVLNEVPYSYNPPITADLDGDGQVEIVAGGDVWRRSGTGWQLAWQTSVEPNQVAVADLDGDGRAEVIHQVLRQQNGPAPGELYPEFSGLVIFDAAGHELRRFPLPGFWSGLITVADTDGDGAPEILVPMDGMLHAVGADGFIKWSFVAPASTATPAPPANVTRTSTLTNVQVYDLDGDGVKEVVFTSLGWVNVLDGRSGLTKAAHAAGPQLATFRTPRLTYVVDWDNDGHADILSIAQGDGTNGGAGSWVLSGAANDWLTAGRSIDRRSTARAPWTTRAACCTTPPWPRASATRRSAARSAIRAPPRRHLVHLCGERRCEQLGAGERVHRDRAAEQSAGGDLARRARSRATPAARTCTRSPPRIRTRATCCTTPS